MVFLPRLEFFMELLAWFFILTWYQSLVFNFFLAWIFTAGWGHFFGIGFQDGACFFSAANSFTVKAAFRQWFPLSWNISPCWGVLLSILVHLMLLPVMPGASSATFYLSQSTSRPPLLLCYVIWEHWRCCTGVELVLVHSVFREHLGAFKVLH